MCYEMLETLIIVSVSLAPPHFLGLKRMTWEAGLGLRRGTSQSSFRNFPTTKHESSLLSLLA